MNLEQKSKEAAGNVGAFGASSYITRRENARSLNNIDFEPGKCYVRAFPKYATTSDTTIGEDAVFNEQELPSHVFIGELLGEPVYNEFLGRTTGFKVPPYRRCIEVVEDLVHGIFTASEKATTNPEEDLNKWLTEVANNVIVHTFDGKDITEPFKSDWVKSVIERIKSQLISEGRMEYNSYSLEEFAGEFATKLKKTYDAILKPALSDMVKDFSVRRTDIATWYSSTQAVSFGKNFFRRGSLPPKEEDDGNTLNMCYRLASVAEHFAREEFISQNGDKYTDFESDNFRKDFFNWIVAGQAVKETRQVWSNPVSSLIHFCVSCECAPDKKTLVVDPSTKAPKTVFGFYTSSATKTRKILAAVKVGEMNSDPDVVTLFFNYASSEKKSEAGKDMTVSEIDTVSFPVKTIQDAFSVIAHDTKHQKVRLFADFPISDAIKHFREWLLVDEKYKLLDPVTYGAALQDLGFEDISTDIEGMVNDALGGALPQTPAVSEDVNPLQAAAMAAVSTVPQQEMSQVQTEQFATVPPVPTPMPQVNIGAVPNVGELPVGGLTGTTVSPVMPQ